MHIVSKLNTILALWIFYLLPSISFAEHVFIDDSFTLERKYGDPIVIKKINFEGKSKVHYTTVDGKEGYTSTFNITNLTELYRATNKSQKSSNQYNYQPDLITNQNLDKTLLKAYYDLSNTLEIQHTNLTAGYTPENNLYSEILDKTLELEKITEKSLGTNPSPSANVPPIFNTFKNQRIASRNAIKSYGQAVGVAKTEQLALITAICYAFESILISDSAIDQRKIPYNKYVPHNQDCLEQPIDVPLPHSPPPAPTFAIKKQATPRPPQYIGDIGRYCKKVSESVGGSYMIEKGCHDNENNAKNKLSRMKISSRIFNYCKNVADVVGRSYVIMKGCVDMEMKAKGQL